MPAKKESPKPAPKKEKKALKRDREEDEFKEPSNDEEKEKELPLESAPKKDKRAAGVCTLTCAPRMVNPRGEDGQLTKDNPTISKRWLACELTCDEGNSKRSDVWLQRDVCLSGKENVSMVKQIKYFLYMFKACSCGHSYHNIGKIELDL